MNDLNYIIENKEKVEKLLKGKLYDVNLDDLVKYVKEKKELQKLTESNKAEQNKLSKSVPEVKKAGGDVKAVFEQVKKLASENKENEERLKELEGKIDEIWFALPNLPDPDLLAGGKENNHPIYTYGKKPEFKFTPKNHVDLAESLGLIDYKRAAKISGSGTWIYTGLGAQLEWALVNFFISQHLKDGFTFILPPHLLNYESGFTAGQFPKFEEDVFVLKGVEPERFLLPTAETALVNLHRDEILGDDDLPKKYFAYTPCYRKEAGSYRTEERGMIRGYQFNKVEMVEYTKDDDSDRAFDELVTKARTLVEKLGLHFQISKLAGHMLPHETIRILEKLHRLFVGYISGYYPKINI